jgi:hypothetical protein
MLQRSVTVSNQNIFPAVKQGLMLTYHDGNCTCLSQLDVRNVLVLSVSQITEDQLLYHPL